MNTLTYTGLGLLSIPLAIGFAVLLNRKGMRFVGLYRTLFFLPVVTMPVAIAMVWRWLYNGDYGLINYLLSLIGIDGPNWVADPATALYALVVVGVWSSVGYNLIIFLAGLQAIPKEYYEAAAIDGASPISQFFHVTLPLLSPTAFFVSVVSVIGSLQLFDLVYVMAGSGGRCAREPGVPPAGDGRPALLRPGLRHQRPRLCGRDRDDAAAHHRRPDRRAVPVPEEVGALCVTRTWECTRS